jgi:hypothetical protein
VKVEKSVLAVVALIWLSSIYAPVQSYLAWEKQNRREPEITEKAAQDYLHFAPQGPYVHDVQVRLDANHKALAIPRLADRSNGWSKKQASRQPSHSQQPTAQTAQPGAKPSKLASLSAQPAGQPPPILQASASPQVNGTLKKHPSEMPQSSSAGEKLASESLEETLAFIADKLASQARINFTAEFHNPTDNSDIIEQLSYEASNASIDPNRCQLSFHWHIEQDGKGTRDRDRAIQLRLAKSIWVETADQALGDLNATAGHPFSVRASPEVYAVHIARWDSPSGDNLYFHDRAMAERIGDATKRALQLCSDGASGPFTEVDGLDQAHHIPTLEGSIRE